MLLLDYHHTMLFLLVGMPSLLCALVATLVIHPTMGRSAVDSLASLGMMDPKVGVPLLLSILFYNKVFCNGDSKSHDLLVSCYLFTTICHLLNYQGLGELFLLASKNIFRLL